MAEPTQIIQIAVEELQPNPLQPRGVVTPESLVDLIDSIREHGILEPLVVANTPAGYQIIAGERRWRAARHVGLTHVPAVVKETTPRGMLELALVENVQRVDLNALDRAKGFERLTLEFGLTNADVAQRTGKSTSYVSNTLRLLKLPDALKDGLLSGLITEGHARALAAVDDSNLMVEAYKIILRESGSVRRAEDLARRMKVKSGQQPAAVTSGDNANKVKIVSEEIDRIQHSIQTALQKTAKAGRKVTVKLTRSQRETKLYVFLKGGLVDTEENLQRIYKAIAA